MARYEREPRFTIIGERCMESLPGALDGNTASRVMQVEWYGHRSFPPGPG